ncbi:MAG: PspA/IM30 family protein [Chloroflexota bacterium]|nr:PspA/IM30 family protein [Chloroflexota bacterium]
MGILDRMSTILRANINSALDKAEDPEKMLDQIIRDMAGAIEEAKGQVAGVIAQEKLLEAEKNNATRSSREWSDRAEKAVKAGRDDLAREALRRKKDFEGIAATYQQQYDTQHEMTSKIRSQLELLMRKYDDAVRNRDVMIARHRSAVAAQQVSKQLAAMSGMDRTSDISRMDQRLRQEEAKALAMVELNSGGTASVEDQFAQLESGDSMDDELKMLKSKMGMGGQQ